MASQEGTGSTSISNTSVFAALPAMTVDSVIDLSDTEDEVEFVSYTPAQQHATSQQAVRPGRVLSHDAAASGSVLHDQARIPGGTTVQQAVRPGTHCSLPGSSTSDQGAHLNSHSPDPSYVLADYHSASMSSREVPGLASACAARRTDGPAPMRGGLRRKPGLASSSVDGSSPRAVEPECFDLASSARMSNANFSPPTRPRRRRTESLNSGVTDVSDAGSAKRPRSLGPLGQDDALNTEWFPN